MFVADGIDEPRPIASMPGVVQHTRDSLRSAAADAVAAGVGGLMLFGVPREQDKDSTGSAGTDPDGILNVALRDLAKDLGEATVLMADTCLDEFTDHGHCGVLDARGRVDNDATVARYVELAVAQAESGAHVVGPSGMMDGQVGAIRDGLDAAGYTDVVILAYAAKFASVFYGPFREAVSSSLSGDRRTYQQEPGNSREALREIELDLDEGADIVMVKPAMSYLDVVAAAADVSPVPVAAYQVSGEYAMICAAAANNWIDERAAALESLTSIRRAGADIVLTYWAADAAGWLSWTGACENHKAGDDISEGSEAVVLRIRCQLVVGNVGPGAAAAMVLIEVWSGAQVSLLVPAIFLVMVSAFVALQVKAARIHVSVELTEDALRQGTETILVREIVKVYPEPENSRRPGRRWHGGSRRGRLANWPGYRAAG